MDLISCDNYPILWVIAVTTIFFGVLDCQTSRQMDGLEQLFWEDPMEHVLVDT
jgi:hypothetical protein